MFVTFIPGFAPDFQLALPVQAQPAHSRPGWPVTVDATKLKDGR